MHLCVYFITLPVDNYFCDGKTSESFHYLCKKNILLSIITVIIEAAVSPEIRLKVKVEIFLRF